MWFVTQGGRGARITVPARANAVTKATPKMSRWIPKDKTVSRNSVLETGKFSESEGPHRAVHICERGGLSVEAVTGEAVFGGRISYNHSNLFWGQHHKSIWPSSIGPPSNTSGRAFGAVAVLEPELFGPSDRLSNFIRSVT